MLDINELLSIFQDPAALDVFDQIVKSRTIRLGDLIKQIHGKQISQEKAKYNLDKLERAGLIAKKGISPGIYTIYYVTADGLQASRKIHQISTW